MEAASNVVVGLVWVTMGVGVGSGSTSPMCGDEDDFRLRQHSRARMMAVMSRMPPTAPPMAGPSTELRPEMSHKQHHDV